MHRLTVLLAAVAMAATAFAPAPAGTAPTGPADVTRTTVDGLDVTIHLDDDPDSAQPVVLEVAESAPDAATVAARRARLAGVGAAYATAVLPACDPTDRVAAVAAVADWARGGTDDGGTRLEGVDGRLVGLALDWSGHDLLAAATDPATPVAFEGLATTGAVLDPHEVAHSDGGVARATTVDDVVAGGPACREGGDASTAPRTAEDEARDLTQRAAALGDTPLLLTHDATSPALASQVVDLWNALRAADDGAPTHLRGLWLSDAVREADFPSDDGSSGMGPTLDTLLAATLGSEPVAGEARRRLRWHPVHEEAAWASCDLGGCRSVGRYGGGFLDTYALVRTHSLYLNRTFEQDLDCTPVCVPGPGTGEVGTLEPVNRFEPPHAPVFTWVDAGADSERLTEDDPLNDGAGLAGQEALPGGHGYHSLTFATSPVSQDAQLLSLRGRAELEGWFQTGSAGGTVTPILLVRSPGGHTQVLARGALDLDFHAGQDQRRHVDGWKRGVVRFEHVTASLWPGDRLEVILQSHNVEHYAPGSPQGTVNVATGPVDGVTTTGSILHLPLYDRHSDAPFED